MKTFPNESSDPASITIDTGRSGCSAASCAAAHATIGAPSEWPSNTSGRPSGGTSAMTAAACA